MESLADKIDKIGDKITFMQGEQSQYLPAIQGMLKSHEERLQAQEKNSAINQGKAGILGLIGGGVMAAIIQVLFKKF